MDLLLRRIDALDHHYLAEFSRGVHILGQLLLEFQLGHDARILAIEEGSALVFIPAGRHHSHPVLDLPASRRFPVASIAQAALEIAHVPLETDDFGVVVEGDPLVAVYPLDQGVQQALGVRSLSRLVQSSQVAAQRVTFFHQEYVISLVGNGQGRGHASQPATDNQGRAVERTAFLVVWLEVTGPGRAHAHLLLGLAGRACWIVGVDPGAVVAQAHEFQQLGIQAFLLNHVVEQRQMRARSTGADNHPVQIVLPDGGTDGLWPTRQAAILQCLCVHYVW